MNRIKSIRKKLGLTQRQLAEAAGTSQQQIQRIENGLQEARFDLAIQICKALDSTMPEVFPESAKALAESKRRGTKPADIFHDHEFASDLSGSGVEMDFIHRWVKLFLKGGHEIVLPISKRDERILSLGLQQQPDTLEFSIFDAMNIRVALNLQHVVVAHFGFEVHGEVAAKGVDVERVQVISPRFEKPIAFDVDPDTVDLDEEENADRVDVQLQDAFYYASCAVPGTTFLLTDMDDETAIVRLDEVSLLSVPLSHVEPKLFLAEDDKEDEILA